VGVVGLHRVDHVVEHLRGQRLAVTAIAFSLELRENLGLEVRISVDLAQLRDHVRCDQRVAGRAALRDPLHPVEEVLAVLIGGRRRELHAARDRDCPRALLVRPGMIDVVVPLLLAVQPLERGLLEREREALLTG
jgi:hypothetical protein